LAKEDGETGHFDIRVGTDCAAGERSGAAVAGAGMSGVSRNERSGRAAGVGMRDMLVEESDRSVAGAAVQCTGSGDGGGNGASGGKEKKVDLCFSES
jgi:hypothetical protein